MPLVTMQYTQGPSGVFGWANTIDMLTIGEGLCCLFAAAIPADAKGTPFKPNDVDFLPQVLPLESIFGSPINFVVETFGYDDR